jgi:hypothetical protein
MTLFKPLMFASMMGFLVRMLDRVIDGPAGMELTLLVVVGIVSYTGVLVLMERDQVRKLLTILLPSWRTP